MTILRHLSPQYRPPETSGANLRYLNFTRELASRRHKVHFLLDDYSLGDDAERGQFISWLLRRAPVADVHSLSPADQESGLRNRVFHPRESKRAIRASRLKVSEEVRRFLANSGADVYLCSIRGKLWLVEMLPGHILRVMDWCDSEALGSWRGIHRERLPGRWGSSSHRPVLTTSGCSRPAAWRRRNSRGAFRRSG